jgi:hypothetical protein
MKHPLDGVREKIGRAELHLKTVTAEMELHKHKCTILAKKRANKDSLFDFYANFPDPSLSLSCVIGDCLHNLRTALDYIVYELAFRDGNPPIHNMFPICNTSIEYKRQVDERDRLRNVPQKARAIIESLQPYTAKGGRHSHPLYILHKLIKADKYRMLALTVICGPHPTLVVHGPTGQSNIKGISITRAFCHGTRIPDQPIEEIQARELMIGIQNGLYLAFKDLPGINSSADLVLSNIAKFIKESIVPRFEPFFDQRSLSVAAK